jgi:hypothetical protein
MNKRAFTNVTTQASYCASSEVRKLDTDMDVDTDKDMEKDTRTDTG